MNMQTEPIRLPLWLASLLSAVVIPLGVALLSDVDLKVALATALGALVPLLGAGEVARRTAWSPESHERAVDHVATLAGALPPADDIPATGSPEAGQANVSGVLWVIFLILAIIVLLRVLGVV